MTLREWVRKHYVPYSEGDSMERLQFMQAFLSRAGYDNVKCLNCHRNWGNHSGTGCMGPERGMYFRIEFDGDCTELTSNDPNTAFRIQRARR